MDAFVPGDIITPENPQGLRLTDPTTIRYDTHVPHGAPVVVLRAHRILDDHYRRTNLWHVTLLLPSGIVKEKMTMYPSTWDRVQSSHRKDIL
jgi:hypothetical protein